jgi:hypothetical protein
VTQLNFTQALKLATMVGAGVRVKLAKNLVHFYPQVVSRKPNFILTPDLRVRMDTERVVNCHRNVDIRNPDKIVDDRKEQNQGEKTVTHLARDQTRPSSFERDSFLSTQLLNNLKTTKFLIN